jgi:hypothetical protein
MKISSLPRCAALLSLALCLSGADCGGGGEPPPANPGDVDSGDIFECSNIQERSYQRASGYFDVGVNGSAVGPWRLGISPVRLHDGRYDVYLSGCIREGGVEKWREAAIARLEGPVKGEPVRLPVPKLSAPGFTGGLLDVVGNREHHFLLRGAGELEVQEFDPEARRFIARGEVYPEQGGTVTLSWELSW